ncbi:hypothetical protein CkaCkLH20_13218 [Colletotrichum karsti]|uniref:Uncharacterized protein n=1 Tax=Colletotrichum karsti TaxID=1095194 RepID=A0A9P6HW12_9PEZI|nr:uncharacterized protein CkaCkLH20_13218 [Colletotrichum karsti]KAF9869301.1 hypothetical protein CkaCkLH20_13218 [Colletotrichum karsti]
MDCLTEGNGDLYGIGVRLGLYFQWAAGFLLRNFSGSWRTISAVRMANNALGLSLMLATMINTSRGLSLSTDFLIVYYLTIALFYAESYNLLTKENANNEGFLYVLKPDLPLLFQNLLFATASVFGGWFWIRGVRMAEEPACGARAAVIGAFDLNNSRWKVFAAVFSVGLGIIFGLFFVIHLAGFWSGQVSRRPVTYIARSLSFASGAPTQIMLALQGLLRPNLPGARNEKWFLRFRAGDLLLLLQFFLINLAGPIIAISSVETMIRTNHLSTDGILESSGQMIALITGVTSLCVAIAEMLGDWFGDWVGRKQALPKDIASELLYNSTKPMEIEEIEEVMKQLSRWISEYQKDDAASHDFDLGMGDFRRPEKETIGPGTTPSIADRRETEAEAYQRPRSV